LQRIPSAEQPLEDEALPAQFLADPADEEHQKKDGTAASDMSGPGSVAPVSTYVQ
jgi:hypothetical protein